MYSSVTIMHARMMRSNVSLISSPSFENSIAVVAGILKVQVIRFDVSLEVSTVAVAMVALRTVVETVGFLQQISHPR